MAIRADAASAVARAGRVLDRHEVGVRPEGPFGGQTPVAELDGRRIGGVARGALGAELLHVAAFESAIARVALLEGLDVLVDAAGVASDLHGLTARRQSVTSAEHETWLHRPVAVMASVRRPMSSNSSVSGTGIVRRRGSISTGNRQAQGLEQVSQNRTAAPVTDRLPASGSTERPSVDPARPLGAPASRRHHQVKWAEGPTIWEGRRRHRRDL